MDKKREFNDALSLLVDVASCNGNKLTYDEISKSFDGIIDFEKSKEDVLKYFADQGITICGCPGENIISSVTFNAHTSETEKNFVEMYLDDMKKINILSEEEHLSLVRRFLEGESLLNELANQNLNLVMDVVNELANSGLTTGDMIQEGNLGLIEGISCYNGEADLELFRMHLTNFIKKAISDAIDEQNSSGRIGVHIADRANALDHASAELAKELEREPTLSELAKYVALDEDEVERIIKMSLDALTIDSE